MFDNNLLVVAFASIIDEIIFKQRRCQVVVLTAESTMNALNEKFSFLNEMWLGLRVR